MTYLSPEQVLFIHSRLIDISGGIHGIRDIGLLQSSIERPKATFEGKDLYADVNHKAAALMESLIKNYPFIDGNKRTTITAAGIFFASQRLSLECCTKEPREIYSQDGSRQGVIAGCGKMVKREYQSRTVGARCYMHLQFSI